MWTPRDSQKQRLKEYEELIEWYQEQLEMYAKELEKEDLTETRRKIYEGLTEVAHKQIKECKKLMKEILEGC